MSQWDKVGNIMGPEGPAGPPGTLPPGQGVYTFVTGEIPTGVIDGTNKLFTAAANFHASSLQVFLNGLRIQDQLEWTIPTGIFNQFLMTQAPMVGDSLQIDYIEL